MMNMQPACVADDSLNLCVVLLFVYFCVAHKHFKQIHAAAAVDFW